MVMPGPLLVWTCWLLYALCSADSALGGTDHSYDIVPAGTDHRINKIVYTFNDDFPLRRFHPGGYPALVKAIRTKSYDKEVAIADEETDPAMPAFRYLSPGRGSLNAKSNYSCTAAVGLPDSDRLNWLELRVVIMSLIDYRNKFVKEFGRTYGKYIPGAKFNVWRYRQSGELIEIATGYLTISDVPPLGLDLNSPLAEDPDQSLRPADEEMDPLPGGVENERSRDELRVGTT